VVKVRIDFAYGDLLKIAIKFFPFNEKYTIFLLYLIVELGFRLIRKRFRKYKPIPIPYNFIFAESESKRKNDKKSLNIIEYYN
jgi:hypothetical protein